MTYTVKHIINEENNLVRVLSMCTALLVFMSDIYFSVYV